tara:strand:- start:90 stop:563 length:474 start_codon:yes stop_codon:yes gene_type:complete
MNKQELKQLIREEISNIINTQTPKVSQWLIDSFISGVQDQKQYGEDIDIMASEGTEDYDYLITAAEVTIESTDSDDTTTEELINAAQEYYIFNKKKPQLNEELYDFVNDIKRTLGTGNRTYEVENYLGRELSYEEKEALKDDGVLVTYTKPKRKYWE